MSRRLRKPSGFTLVEILIVVVILGILAAIVVPQFTNASEAARASNLTSQLQSIRSQLELYQLQHNGNYPLLAVEMDGTGAAGGSMFFNLTQVSDSLGAVPAGAGLPTFGPYMQSPPSNPFTNTPAVVANGGAAAGVGWTYNEATGDIRASILAATATANNISVAVIGGDAETY